MQKRFVPTAREQSGILSSVFPMYGMAKEIGNMNEAPVDEYGAPISGQYFNPNQASLLDMLKKKKGSSSGVDAQGLASMFKLFM